MRFPHVLIPLVFALIGPTACAAVSAKDSPKQKVSRRANRVATMLVSELFLNEVFTDHLKSELVPELKVNFEPAKGRIYFKGLAVVPLEEMRAINLDPSISSFRFQVSVKPSVTDQGHLRLEFPVEETYFYPAKSKNPTKGRFIVPVQMLSIGLASARGYLAALSGDFSGFDRREAKMKAKLKSLDGRISSEKNADLLEELKTERLSVRLKLDSIPIERKQLEGMGKQVGKILGFSGEKEMDLNKELGASENSVMLKLKLSQIFPYLKGVGLGGVRVVNDTRDGPAQNMLAVDLNSDIEIPMATSGKFNRGLHQPSKYRTSITIRLNQRLFETEAVRSAEFEAANPKIRDLKFDFRDDGLHVSGGYHLLLVTIPFDTVVDFYSTSPDHFDVRVRSLDIAGLDLDYLKKVALESIKKKLNENFPGVCQFEDAKEGPERILKVIVDPKALVPAFPNLHLIDVDVRERFFLMKIGKVESLPAKTETETSPKH